MFFVLIVEDDHMMITVKIETLAMEDFKVLNEYIIYYFWTLNPIQSNIDVMSMSLVPKKNLSSLNVINKHRFLLSAQSIYIYIRSGCAALLPRQIFRSVRK